jgi:PKD repeat protein
MKNLLNLACAGALLALAIVVMLSSCGGGGSNLPNPNPQNATTVADASQAYDNGSHIKTRVYSGVSDDAAIPDGTVINLAEGESRVFFAKHFAKLLQPTRPIRYAEEETTEIPGMRTIVAFKGLDQSNMGITGNLEFSTGLITIAFDDLPKGGRYDLSFKGAIPPSNLLAFVNGRIEDARPPTPPGNGGNSSDDAGWFIGGLAIGLLGLAICPTDAAGIILTRAAGVTPPPPPERVLARVAPTPASISTDPGGMVTPLSATAYDADDVVIITGVLYSWSVTDPAAGSVDDLGGGSARFWSGTKPGSYPGVVKVVASYGGVIVTANVSVTVRPVQPPVNQPPVAKLVVSPTSGESPLTVHADGSGSYDLDGTVVKYEWFFYGGGGHADIGGTTMNHTYDVPGDYSVWLRITDDDGAIAWSAAGVNITVTAPPSEPPIAGMSAIPSTGPAPLAVAFDGSASTGNPTSYSWDFTNDGSTDATGVTADHTYAVAGTYTAKLTVTNVTGSDTAATTITVTPAQQINYDLFPKDHNGNINGYFSGQGQQSLTLELEPIPAGVGFVLWEITEGPSGAGTVPLGNQPCAACEFYYSAAGTYKVHAVPYTSESSYQNGDAAIGSEADFIITITAG